MNCNVCGEGHDPDDFQLAARVDSNQRICCLCVGGNAKVIGGNASYIS